jgi:quinoprotein glucose dehydrogenase
VSSGVLLALSDPRVLDRQSALAAAATPSTGAYVAKGGERVVYGRDAGDMRRSPLAQIDRDNVAALAVAWTYLTGELALHEGIKLGQRLSCKATPQMVDGALYVSTPTNRVIARDAATVADLPPLLPATYRTTGGVRWTHRWHEATGWPTRSAERAARS